MLIDGRLTGSEAISRLNPSDLASVSRTVQKALKFKAISVQASFDPALRSYVVSAPNITFASYYANPTFKFIVPVFYTGIKKSTTLTDDLVLLDGGTRLEDMHCAIRNVYRKPKYGSNTWIQLNPISQHMFKLVPNSLSDRSLRLRVRMSLAYGFLYPMSISKLHRRLIENNSNNSTEESSSSQQDEGIVEAANVLSSDYVNDYSIIIGCGGNSTYVLRITIVPKIQRIRSSRSSRFCKPDDLDLTGIEDYMPELINVRKDMGQMMI